MKKQRLSFQRLVEKNKEELLKDQSAIEKIEEKLDKKHADIINSQQAM